MPCGALVWTAPREAAERPAALFVRTALRAAAKHRAAVQQDAARFAWREIVLWDAELRDSRSMTRETARETRGR